MRATTDKHVYRSLQKHLDRQAIGFPATVSGADIRFLQRMFTPDEARLALHLSYQPRPLGKIMLTASGECTAERALQLLHSMSMKGSIGFKERNGQDSWFVLPMVIGMYEAQDGCPTEDFLRDADEYMRTIAFGKSFLSIKPSQMRTIPINVSITPQHTVATYDQIRLLIQSSGGPFVVLPCICREGRAIHGESCKVTARTETCFAMGSIAAMVLRRGHGREVVREEALEVLQLNQDEGLVLQPSNAQKAEFVCSCCGCCCGMLRMQKMLPHPVDFWTTSFQAEINADVCTGCGLCVKRCQVEAVVLKGSPGKAFIHENRCIGCGLCVPTCPTKAIRLISRDDMTIPPMTEEDLNDQIMWEKRGSAGRFLMLLKVLLRIRQ